MSDGGKGSGPRPYSVSKKEYDDRWEAIFGADKKPKSNQRISLGGEPYYVAAIIFVFVLCVLAFLK
jgi:hypothetical protein